MTLPLLFLEEIESSPIGEEDRSRFSYPQVVTKMNRIANPPLVSIISIVLNNRQGLCQTAASVKEQTLKDYEWLVIDGGSTDGSLEDALKARSPSTLTLSEPDAGICDAMNKGMTLATGLFVVFLNAGDTFAENDTLACLEPLFRNDHVDFIYGDKLDNKAGRLCYKAASHHKGIAYGMFGCHQAMYYRRSIIGPLRFDTRLRVSGDYDFTARFLQKTNRIHRVHKALCIFGEPTISLQFYKRGRSENWIVQRDVLGVRLGKRLIYRISYQIMFLFFHHLPFVYHKLQDWRLKNES